MKRGNFPRPLLLLIAGLAAGCAGGPYEATIPDFTTARAILVDNHEAPADEGDDEEESEEDEEMVGLLNPKPTDTTPTVKPKKRMSRVGGRAVFLISGPSEEDDFDPAPGAGVFLRKAFESKKNIILEVGADFVPLETGEGAVSSDLIIGHAEILWGRFDPRDRNTTPYLLGGADLISESLTREATGETDTAIAGGILLGAGIGSTRGKWDLRAVFSFLPGSENVEHNTMVAAGMSF